MLKSILLVALLVSSAYCDDSKTIKKTGCSNGPSASTDIVQLKDEDLSWMAMILHADYFICGGALVNSRWVLTTADCLLKIPAAEITIVLGSKSLIKKESFSKSFKVKKTVSHNMFSLQNSVNDIALIELVEPVAYSAHISQACLGQDTADAAATLTPLYNTRENRLGLLSVKHLEDAVCSKITLIRDPKKEFCYVPNGKIDNGYIYMDVRGSPLTSRSKSGDWQVIGLVQMKLNRKQARVYTRIGGLLDWIQETIKA